MIELFLRFPPVLENITNTFAEDTPIAGKRLCTIGNYLRNACTQATCRSQNSSTTSFEEEKPSVDAGL